MKREVMGLVFAGLLVLAAAPALADDDDIEGRIEAVNADDQSFVVDGITIYATKTTDYDDGLERFSDLVIGQKVEVDFVIRDGKHYAQEIELDD